MSKRATGAPRVRKTKPLDLNAHPMADVLRRALAGMDEARQSIDDDPEFALDWIQDRVLVRNAETDEILVECAALALAGLAALDAQKGGA